MDNQHKKISGYRDLSQEEIDLMNEGKELEEKCLDFMDRLLVSEGANLRSAALGRTNLQTGFMWAIRAVARPGGE